MARKTRIYTVKHFNGNDWAEIARFEGKTKTKAENWMWNFIKENGYYADEFTLTREDA